MGLDGFVGVDGLVAHGHVDVAVTGDDLCDVGGRPLHHGIGDEHATKVMRACSERVPVGWVRRARCEPGPPSKQVCA